MALIFLASAAIVIGGLAVIPALGGFQTAQASSKNITVEIKARVTSVDDSFNILNGVVKEGDLITGKYVYNILSQDTHEDPTVGDYDYNKNPSGIFLKTGKLIFQTDPKNVDFRLELINGEDSDSFFLVSYINRPLSKEVSVSVIEWILDDPTASALSSDSLKEGPRAPDLSKWQQTFGLIIEVFQTGDEEDDSSSIRAQVFSAEMK